MANDTKTTSTPVGTPQQRHFSTPPIFNESAPSSYNSRSSVQSISKSNRLSTPSSLSNRLSLTSSRPAPPSPAVSRRTSTALSSVAVPSLTPSTSRPNSFEKRGSLLPLTPTAPETPTPAGNPELFSSSPRRSIQIRDYAFRVSISDPRALGLGEDVPKPNRVRLLNRKLLGEQGWKIWRKRKREERKRARGSVGSIGSVGSVASSQHSEDDWEEADMVRYCPYRCLAFGCLRFVVRLFFSCRVPLIHFIHLLLPVSIIDDCPFSLLHHPFFRHRNCLTTY